ncbi:helix-turn-helix domain-containing protein [Miniphocaeibacter massiliensis]|uniref:helix-turn-helix domain-containing protein n=1 Tax=Miniphocaeibacter massiliensis TaxID=2041841 RepID=UPI000C070CC0|nr:XRE family transcriptional regulator [Miniphocaeibacter massiliensis]
MDIGDKIKNRRMALGLTQEDLAERADLTKGFISQLERDLTSPSVDSLFDILEALGTNISDFFKEEKEEKVVFKKDDFITNIDEENRNSIEWIVPNAQKNEMEPIILNLEPKGKSKVYDPNEGETFGYILKGKVRLVLDDKIHDLEAKECFYTPCNKSMYIINRSGSESKVLWITNPPSF